MLLSFAVFGGVPMCHGIGCVLQQTFVAASAFCCRTHHGCDVASTNLFVVMFSFWIAGCVYIWMKTRDDVSVC